MTDNVTTLKKAAPAPLPFAPGDVVALNSGGALMVVRKATKEAVEVDWLDDYNQPQACSYPPCMLQMPATEEPPSDEIGML